MLVLLDVKQISFLLHLIGEKYPGGLSQHKTEDGVKVGVVQAALSVSLEAAAMLQGGGQCTTE